MKGLRDLTPAVYDMTVIYDDGKSFRPSIAAVVLGEGITVNVHVRRYPMEGEV
jgi:hypothetical protein